ncbi:AAA domain-containing protein [Microcella alkaliphila]|uniref:AAA domain-containing protein n=1 Tax=Microcella alkaliphila TaxID=279828 RepID=A0A4Q7TG17_9MICO|nr:ParA family protein [Microcella alkaliphila]RZT59411.1 AAA domain-containing protein [Microcella alkaliphila]
MESIAFFNNKGGVGKTTLVCNLAHYLATEQQKRVVLVDLDPQCNSTQLVLTSEQCAALYWPDEAFINALDGGDSAVWDSMHGVSTIYDAVRPLEEGDATSDPVQPLSATTNRFMIDLVPGHPRMSVFEDKLGQWFAEASAGDVAGLRKTLWLRQIIEELEPKYDVVLFDLGPSLGALNRSVLASAKNFVTPMGADIFSVVALRNIAEWIVQWARLYRQGVKLCETNNPGAVDRFGIPSEVAVDKGFIGYTVQQYSTVTIRGERRATVAYDQILSQVPSQVERHLSGMSKPGLELSHLKLGDIPNLRSLVPLAQSANAPLGALTSGDGLAGGQYSQQRSYVEFINVVGANLSTNCFS